MRITLAAFLVLLLPSAARAELPLGWQLLTSSPEWYQGLRSEEGARSGRGVGILQGQSRATASSYALLAQKISAADYKGRRVRLSAYLRTESVSGRAGLWMRVDGRQGETLAFENMQDRPVRGDQAWIPISVELEVAAEAAEVHYGLLLQGGGKALIDDLKLESLGPASPTAKARSKVRGLPRSPVNGDFER